ncbi:uncharacterized protein LOC133183224 [Saccostrea echinata]|uniref:uncharacterized protein LOC133183224 n=1 Tax=Saccostrea echinata TaxID=191078 RepID=UPI002A7EC749|nr:uncharacterized protein LOC133183224 [Saccostrea echinata]
MGSGSSRSSQVHSFQVEQGNKEDDDVRPKTGRETKRVCSLSAQHRPSVQIKRSQSMSSTVSPRVAPSIHKQKSEEETTSDVKVNIDDKERQLFEAQEKMTVLQKQLTETESQNLDLQERVEVLEERLEYLNSCHQIQEEPEGYQETIKAKNQFIEKLEKEQKQQTQEFNKTKIRYKKRIKALTTQLNEAKQETSIQLFELKDEITRLQEKNKELEDSLERAGPQGKTNTPDVGKMQIVLELSNQISEQTDEISRLKKEVKVKESIIDRLGGTKNLEEEYSKDKEDMKNLKKLSQGLNQLHSESEGLRDSEEDDRGVSGASRDSGLGSAGKNKDRRKDKSGIPVLSDSDWESDDLPDELGPCKIKSAPPETQALRAASRLAAMEGNDTGYPTRQASRESNDSRLPSRLASRESIGSRLPSRLASRESQFSSKTLMENDEDQISVDDMTSYKGSHKMRKKSSFTSKIRREHDTSLRTPIPSVAFEEEKNINDIPMYPSSSSKRYSRKKKSSFFLTQTGNSPAGSDISEQISVG